MLFLRLLTCALGHVSLGAENGCTQHLALPKKLLPLNADSALFHAEEAEKCMAELGTSEERARVLIGLGDAQQALRDMPAALGAYQRAQRVVEQAMESEGPTAALQLTRADIELNIGLLHFNLRDAEKSIVHYNSALRMLDSAPGLDSGDLALRKVRLFNNMGAVYVRRSDYTTALPYFQQALAMNRPLNDARKEGSLNNNIGICLMELGRYQQANEFFLRVFDGSGRFCGGSVWDRVGRGIADWRCKQKENTAMSDDIKTHLETIREIDGTGYRRGRERTQALKALAEEVADALLTGRPVPVYTHVEEFFSVNGFAEAVSDAIVAQGKTAVDQRYALSKHVEEKGVEHGREAARILREMNAQSAALPWELPGSHIELAPMPGWTVERTPDGGAKGFFRNVILDEVDNTPFEKPAAKPIDDLVRDAIAKLGSKPETSAITHLLPVDGFQVKVKVERVAEEDRHQKK